MTSSNRSYLLLTNKIPSSMKLTALSLMLSLSAFAANADAQQVSVTVSNAKVKTVLNSISDQTGLSLAYSAQVVDLNRKVSLNFVNTEVSEVLNAMFGNTAIGYEIKDGKIYLFKAAEKTTALANQQKKIITGTVVDPNGEAVIGANVLVKGTTNGTITDMDGKFSLEVPEGAMLLVSYIGYGDYETKVGNQSNLSITLKEDSQALDEVVVVGYGTQKKISAVGSISAVKAKDLVQAPVSNVSNALGGRLPGLISSQVSGEPGLDNASINIRGFGNALVIVDGVESSIGALSANEIADITILKDASAAIYGSRAGNGVILITTKRGNIGKPKIELNATFSWQQPTIYPKKLTAGEYTRFMYEKDVRANVDPSKYAYPLSEVQKWEEGLTPDYQSTDWWDFLMKKFAPFQQYNLSTTGGSEKIKYYISYNRSDQSGILKSNSYKYSTNNFRSNIDAQINKNFSILGDISAMISNINTPPREQEWIWQDIANVLPTWHATLPDPTKIPYTGNVTSIVASTSDKGGYKKKNYFQFSSKLMFTYKLPWIKGLEAKAMINYQRNTNETKYWMKGYDMWKYNWENDSYTKEGSAWQTRLNEGWNSENKFTSNIGLYYEQKFNEHSISAMLLNEIIQSSGKDINGGTDGFLGDNIDYLFAGSDSSDRISGGAWENGRVSYVSRINYNFKSKYIIEASMRYDGSAVFAPGKRWGFFPSLSTAWRISEEAFFDKLDFVSNLKLRLGVSKSGYDGIGNFQYITGYNTSASGVVDNKIISGIRESGLANPDITWEKLNLYNAGIDYGFLDEKIYGSLDLFYRYRYDILATPIATMPSTFGANLPQMNLNSVSNRGFELVLGHRNKINEFSYDLKANISFARERNEHIEEPSYSDPDEKRIKQKSGQWSDLIWGLETDGLFTSQEEIDNYPVILDSREGFGNSLVKPGQIKYVDQNGDNKIDWRDQVVIGRKASIQRIIPNDVTSGNQYVNITAPEFMYGFDFSARYKNIDISFLFQGGAGFSTWVWANDYTVYHNSWTEENNDPNALFPVQGPEGAAVTGGVPDYNLVNVKYLRLKTLNIGYTIPEKYLQALKLKVFLSGYNLLTFSNLNKYQMDPEAPDGGCYYPQQRVFTVGLNVSF